MVCGDGRRRYDLVGHKARPPGCRSTSLGGASRTALRTYGHASGRDIPELFDSIRHHLEEGYESIRVQTSVPGIKALCGVAAQAQATGNGTISNPLVEAHSLPRRTGTPGHTCGTARWSSKRFETNLVPRIRCCTMGSIA